MIFFFRIWAVFGIVFAFPVLVSPTFSDLGLLRHATVSCLVKLAFEVVIVWISISISLCWIVVVISFFFLDNEGVRVL